MAELDAGVGDGARDEVHAATLAASRRQDMDLIMNPNVRRSVVLIEPLVQVEIVTAAVFVLGAVLFCALLVIPLGLPGTWLIVATALAYLLLVPHSGITVITIVGTAAIALGAELLELLVVGRTTRRYGGSRRAAWGAIMGGLLGAMVGVPVPIVGPMLGGFVGAFLGALLGEFEATGDHRVAASAAFGAIVARAASMAMKVAVAVVMAAWILAAAVAGA